MIHDTTSTKESDATQEKTGGGWMRRLVHRLLDYGFDCEAGPLEKCREWIDLKDSIMKAPEYDMGQRVAFYVSGKIDGVEATVEASGWITAMRFGSSTTARFVEYGITDDLVDVYHYGKPPQWWRQGFEISPMNAEVRHGAKDADPN